jgi:hypothetical protein
VNPKRRKLKNQMINLTETLPRLDIEIAAFEAELGKLRDLEKNQSSLQAELRESQNEEGKILADKTSDAKQVAERLHRQRALTDTLRSRVEDVEKTWLSAYAAGAIAKQTFDICADAFRAQHPAPPANPFDRVRTPNPFDFRWGAVPIPPNAFSPVLPADRKRTVIHSYVCEWGELRPRFIQLRDAYELDQAQRRRVFAEAGTLTAEQSPSKQAAGAKAKEVAAR